eukprot:TRINITY_DN16322_c0_g1_i1.p1 TRINITY_DN16322_c0_g1~~TRINITY_DN16322_c0_g1_i1.p1  ORF type:complete len:1111 (+),score=420.79 TRINITY_DN16322_c0_g1_i1:56-3334(+)
MRAAACAGRLCAHVGTCGAVLQFAAAAKPAKRVRPATGQFRGAAGASPALRKRIQDSDARERREVGEDGVDSGASKSTLQETWRQYIARTAAQQLQWNVLFSCAGAAKLTEDIEPLFAALKAAKPLDHKFSDDTVAIIFREFRWLWIRVAEKSSGGTFDSKPCANVMTFLARKMFMEGDGRFTVGIQSSNVLLRALYDGNYPIEKIFQFYGTFQARKVKVNAVTFGLMYSACLRGRKKENAKKFYDACSKILEAEKVTYRSKFDLVSNISLGLADARQPEAIMQFIEQLRTLYIDGDRPAEIPHSQNDRKSKHLYIEPRVVRVMFWAASSASSRSLLEQLSQWFELVKMLPDFPHRCYGYFLRACALSNDVNRAFEVWDEIVAKGIRAPHVTISNCQSVIDAVSRQRSQAVQYGDRALNMLEQVRSMNMLAGDEHESMYINLVKVYLASDNFEKAHHFYRVLKDKGLLTTDLMLKLFCLSSNAKSHLDVVKSVFDDARELARESRANDGQFELTARAVNAYFGVLADLGKSEELEALIDEMSTRHEFKKDLETYNRVLEACGKDKAATSYGTFYRYNADGQEDYPLYFSYMKNRKTSVANCDTAQRVFDKLVREGFEPEVKTYNCLMQVYARAGNQQEVFRILKDMQQRQGEKKLEPDTFSYMAMVSACSENGDVVKVADVVDTMLSQTKIAINPMMCSLLVKALSNCGVQVRTLVYTREVTDGELEFTQQGADCKTVRSFQPRLLEVETGFRIVDAMHKIGYKADVRTLSALMGLCARAGEWGRARNLYEQIQRSNMMIRDRPDLLTNILKLHHHENNVQAAVDLLKDSFQAGTQLQLTAYLSCLSASAKAGDVDSALDVVELLARDPNEKASDMAVALVLLACAKADTTSEYHDRVSRARDLLSEFRARAETHPESYGTVDTQHVFHTLMFVAVVDANADAVKDVLTEMKERNIPISPVSLTYFPRALAASGAAGADRLAETWALLDIERKLPDQALVYQMLMVCQEAENLVLAAETLAEAHRRVPQIDGLKSLGAMVVLLGRRLKASAADEGRAWSILAGTGLTQSECERTVREILEGDSTPDLRAIDV